MTLYNLFLSKDDPIVTQENLTQFAGGIKLTVTDKIDKVLQLLGTVVDTEESKTLEELVDGEATGREVGEILNMIKLILTEIKEALERKDVTIEEDELRLSDVPGYIDEIKDKNLEEIERRLEEAV